jgi:hypothetical protein
MLHEENTNVDFADDNTNNVEVARCMQDGMSIEGADLSDTAPFYSSSYRPLYNDDDLLKDAMREASEHHMATTEELGFRKSGMREQLENGLYWEAQREDGKSEEPNRALRIENKLRCVKSMYAVMRASLSLKKELALSFKAMEEKTGPAPAARTLKNGDFVHVWDITATERLAVYFQNAGIERTLRAFKFRDGHWVEAEHLAGMEFPLYARSTGKDPVTNKYSFQNQLPGIQKLVVCLMHPEARLFIEGLYDEMFVAIKESVKEELESEVACTYLGVETDLNNIEFYGDDGEAVRNVEAELDFGEQELLEGGSPVDAKWSAAKLSEIIEELDPECLGFATSPLLGHGHETVEESLRWLMGDNRAVSKTRPQGIKGFVSHSALTREDREILIDFGRESFRCLQANKQYAANMGGLLGALEAAAE